MANNVVDLTTIPLEDKFRTQLSQQWTGWTWSISVANTPNFTFPAWQTCYVVVNPWKDNMQIAEIDSYDSWAKTLNVTNVTLEKWASINSTAQTHSVWSELISEVKSRADISVFSSSFELVKSAIWPSNEMYPNADTTNAITATIAMMYVIVLSNITHPLGWIIHP